MKYSLDIRKCNEKAHLAIESDIAFKKNGLFTCTIRVNNSVIVDYNFIEYVNIQEYDGLEQAIIEELTLAYNSQQRSNKDTLRQYNDQRGDSKRSSKVKDSQHSEKQA